MIKTAIPLQTTKNEYSHDLVDSRIGELWHDKHTGTTHVWNGAAWELCSETNITPIDIDEAYNCLIKGPAVTMSHCGNCIDINLASEGLRMRRYEPEIENIVIYPGMFDAP